jgi:hypothetical protein
MVSLLMLLGNTILVKLELWESVMVIISFGLPLTYAYATLRQSVAGNLTFRGIVFCNLGTAKTDIKIRHQGIYCYPIYIPIWLPQRCSRGTKKRLPDKKTRLQQCINSLLAHKLSHDR